MTKDGVFFSSDGTFPLECSPLCGSPRFACTVSVKAGRSKGVIPGQGGV